ncbi:MAG: heme-binding protein [Acidobacteriota bacterium]
MIRSVMNGPIFKVGQTFLSGYRCLKARWSQTRLRPWKVGQTFLSVYRCLEARWSHTNLHLTYDRQECLSYPQEWLSYVFAFCILVLLSAQASAQSTQPSRPILFSAPDSTRGVVIDSVSSKREPFSTTAPISFAPDNVTRIMLIAGNLKLAQGEGPAVVTADAEDESHRIYSLKVEYVGPVPEQIWATSVVLRLNEQMGDVGDVLVRIYYKGSASNRVRVGIGHVGGGPPDDPGSVPTPGPTGSLNINPITAGTLTTNEVQTIIAQAVSAAVALNKLVTVAVTDREGNVLGVFSMTGAPSMMQIRGGGPLQTPNPITGLVPVGLEGTRLPSVDGAISKAGTAALFATSGNAFTTRTAGFIIQEHFPPGVSFQAGGPLYGVQFSSLPCSDIKIPGLKLGLSGDPGGLPIYKNGIAQGGVGIEGDGVYGIDRDPSDFDQPFEEIIALSAIRSFEPPSGIRADNILVNGIRLPFVNPTTALQPPTISFGSLPGAVDPAFPIRAAQPSAFTSVTVGGIAGESDPRFFPFIASPSGGPNALTATDVNLIISHAAQQANITRAAIRQPLGSNARVSIAVVDTNGVVLGLFRQQDAPVFGFDVSVQKARTAAFISTASAGTLLRSAGLGSYVDRAVADGIKLDGSVAFSDRAIGFLHRPFFPDGINDTAAGPFSTELNQWSVFNVGLQLDLIKTNFQAAIVGAQVPCSSIAGLANGMQIFPGSVPLYKNGVLVGAIGISGDGVDQDDIIGAAGGNGYSPAPAIRSDQVFVRGVRLPFLKFPRSPNL